ncbi:EthD family reductase [Pseudodonghicola flavimaris]|uniref:EthD family reductase n=1 Tax=Pseudodonghicola flavimaris TaxID=3050036 RepID=A0ABT7F1C5_9RHOB|nr:EthD family reductase [Pseudodonghicola flavimaris]MDK3018398.1 EthD family reductase [Pseudodonghicola flavimaris]
MIKRCTLLRRREDVPVPAFRDHWSSIHADIAAGFDGLDRYNQNHVTRVCWQFGPPRFQVDGIVELWFGSQADVDRAAQSDTTRALIVDEPNFLSGLTALVVGEADCPQAAAAEAAKYMVLARSTAPVRLEAALVAHCAALTAAGTAITLSIDPLTPGFTRETLWSEPQPPTLLISIRTADPRLVSETSALRGIINDHAEAALAVAVDELRIV